MFGLNVLGLEPIRPLPRSNGKANIGYRSCDGGNFSAKVSRHTGKPHQHSREIARNARRVRASDDAYAGSVGFL